MMQQYRQPYRVRKSAVGAIMAGAAGYGSYALNKYAGKLARSTYPGSRLRSSNVKIKKNRASLNANSNRGGYRGKRKTVRRHKKSKISQIASQVRSLQKTSKADMGMLTFRIRSTGRNLSGINSCSYTDVSGVDNTLLELVLQQLRYYDAENPGTLLTAPGTTGSFMKEFYFKKVFNKLLIRNNYQVPCRVAIYNMQVKSDTSITPKTAFTNGLTDVGAPTSTSPIVYPSDSPQFLDLWKIIKTTKVVLQPGEECVLTHLSKTFSYDPSLVDSHAGLYQPRYAGFAFLIRTEGILGHDTSVDEQGILAAGIDWQMDSTLVVEYSAGADIEYVYVTDGSDTFTNSAVVSSKPVSDNITYSVS